MNDEHDHKHKEKKFQYFMIAGIVVILLFNNMIVYNKLLSLEIQVQNMIGVVSGYGFSSDLSGMEQRLFDEMKKGASILTDSSSELSAKDGFFEVTVKVAPKEIKTEDKVFIVLNNQKIQARSINGVTYEAVMPIKSFNNVKPYVVIENGENHLQEVLPEIYFDQFTAVEFIGMSFGEVDKKLSFEITALTEESVPFLENLNEAEAVIFDDNQNEIRRLQFTPAGTENPGVDEHGYKLKAYELNLPEDIFQMEYFQVAVILKGNGVTLTSEEIFNHSKSNILQGIVGGGGFSISYDE